MCCDNENDVNLNGLCQTVCDPPTNYVKNEGVCECATNPSDIVDNNGICCPEGQVNQNGICRDSCETPNYKQDGEICICADKV